MLCYKILPKITVQGGKVLQSKEQVSYILGGNKGFLCCAKPNQMNFNCVFYKSNSLSSISRYCWRPTRKSGFLCANCTPPRGGNTPEDTPARPAAAAVTPGPAAWEKRTPAFERVHGVKCAPSRRPRSAGNLKNQYSPHPLAHNRGSGDLPSEGPGRPPPPAPGLTQPTETAVKDGVNPQ